MKYRMKKLFAMLLTLIMALNMMPVSAWAQNGQEPKIDIKPSVKLRNLLAEPNSRRILYLYGTGVVPTPCPAGNYYLLITNSEGRILSFSDKLNNLSQFSDINFYNTGGSFDWRTGLNTGHQFYIAWSDSYQRGAEDVNNNNVFQGKLLLTDKPSVSNGYEFYYSDADDNSGTGINRTIHVEKHIPDTFDVEINFKDYDGVTNLEAPRVDGDYYLIVLDTTDFNAATVAELGDDTYWYIQKLDGYAETAAPILWSPDAKK